MLLRSSLLLTAAVLAPATAFAQAVPSEPAASQSAAVSDEEAEEGETVVVTGQRPRGSVVGDIPPENVLNAATSAPPARPASRTARRHRAADRQRPRPRGGPPVLLLNGRRISGFRELRDIPPEAIERMEILPEEVALKYGYRADQRVVNFVLRRRFHSTVGRGRRHGRDRRRLCGGHGRRDQAAHSQRHSARPSTCMSRPTARSTKTSAISTLAGPRPVSTPRDLPQPDRLAANWSAAAAPSTARSSAMSVRHSTPRSGTTTAAVGLRLRR